MIKKLYVLLFISIISLCAHQNFILLGPPGSGKGTFAQYMTQHHGYKHLAIGDLLRLEIKKETPLGLQVKETVDRGDYVDQALVYEIVNGALSTCIEQGEPFILDGLPKSEATWQWLLNFLQDHAVVNITKAVVFECSDAVCLPRVAQRLICYDCGQVYNKQTALPKVAGMCDQCGSKVEARFADTDATTCKRIAYYRSTIEPLIAKIAEDVPIACVDAEQPVAELKKAYEQIMLVGLLN